MKDEQWIKSTFDFEKKINWTSDFDIKRFEKLLRTKDENFWQSLGEKRALKLFHSMALRVPAYKDFLKKYKIQHRKIKTIKDFQQVPITDKKNYINAYPLEERCWDGDITTSDIIFASSGTTGKPTFWSRGVYQDDETTISHDLFLRNNFDIDKKTTLFVVTFGMGMWVAGTLTYECINRLAQKYDMTVVTPGVDKDNALNIIKKLGSKYDQVIIAGYPPFVKDIIDGGFLYKINWKKLNIKFLFAAEAVSEDWRDYLYEKTGSKVPFQDSLNIYGGADALVLGHETPLSIIIRRLALDNLIFYNALFGDTDREPSLVQYNPLFRFFEKRDDGRGLVFSSYSGTPLARYSTWDEGNIISLLWMKKELSKYKISIEKELKKYKIKEISAWKLPFVSVMGRGNHTASIYGINIYPENIKAALTREVGAKVATGKFTVITKMDNKKNSYLEINLELKERQKRTLALKEKLKELIIRTLKEKSSEYTKLYGAIGKRADPIINLHRYGSKKFFKPGGKHIWHKKI